MAAVVDRVLTAEANYEKLLGAEEQDEDAIAAAEDVLEDAKKKRDKTSAGNRKGGKNSRKSGKDASHKKAHEKGSKRWYICNTCKQRYLSGAKQPMHRKVSIPPCSTSKSRGISVCCHKSVCNCDGNGNLA